VAEGGGVPGVQSVGVVYDGIGNRFSKMSVWDQHTLDVRLQPVVVLHRVCT